MKLGQPERHCYQVNKNVNKQGVFLISPALRRFGRDKSGHGRALMLLIAFAWGIMGVCRSSVLCGAYAPGIPADLVLSAAPVAGKPAETAIIPGSIYS